MHKDVEKMLKVAFILSAAHEALEKYSEDNLDLMKNEENGMLYIGFHSDNNSFPVSDFIVSADEVDIDFAIAEMDKLHIGHCI